MGGRLVLEIIKSVKMARFEANGKEFIDIWHFEGDDDSCLHIDFPKGALIEHKGKSFLIILMPDGSRVAIHLPPEKDVEETVE